MRHTLTEKLQTKLIHDQLSNTYDVVHEDRSEQSDVIQHDISGLAAAITESMAFARIPIAKPPVFNGDPLEYHSWKVTFDMMVSQKNITPREKILFLK